MIREDAVAARLDALARIICADKMGLLTDVLGERLPDELWQQFRPHAQAILVLVQSGDRQ